MLAIRIRCVDDTEDEENGKLNDHFKTNPFDGDERTPEESAVGSRKQKEPSPKGTDAYNDVREFPFYHDFVVLICCAYAEGGRYDCRRAQGDARGRQKADKRAAL